MKDTPHEIKLPQFLDLSRFYLLIVTLLGLGVAAFIGQMIGQGKGSAVGAVIALTLAAAAGISVGDRYWMILPFGAALSLPTFSIGGRSLQVDEAAGAAALGFYLCRLALKRERFRPLTGVDLPILGYMLWVFFVYLQNPIGLAAFGSQMGGSREYINLILAFTSYLILSNQTIGEKELKWIIFLPIVGIYIKTIYSLAGFGSIETEEDTSAAGASLAALSAPANLTVLYLFSRYKIREIFSMAKPWIVPVALFCCLMVFFSGKRSVATTLLLMPLLAALLRKEFVFSILYGGLVALGISILVIGQGTLFTLPLSAQRVLMNLPGQWDSRVLSALGDTGSIDSWRYNLRMQAYERIQENPIFGKGLGIDLRDIEDAEDRLRSGTYSEDNNVHAAMGAAWHNTWLGIAANFGIPACLPFFFFLILYFKISKRLYEAHPHGSLGHTFAFMMVLGWFGIVLRSWTSGNGVTWASSLWPIYGIVLSVYRTTVARDDAAAVVKEEPGRSISAAEDAYYPGASYGRHGRGLPATSK